MFMILITRTTMITMALMHEQMHQWTQEKN